MIIDINIQFGLKIYFGSVQVCNSVQFRVVNSGSNTVWVAEQFLLLISGRFVTSGQVPNSIYNNHY